MRSHDLEHQLFSKEKELEGLFQKQKSVSFPQQPGKVSILPLRLLPSLSRPSWSFSAAS